MLKYFRKGNNCVFALCKKGQQWSESESTNVFRGENATRLVPLMQLQVKLQKRGKYRIYKQTKNKQGIKKKGTTDAFKAQR